MLFSPKPKPNLSLLPETILPLLPSRKHWPMPHSFLIRSLTYLFSLMTDASDSAVGAVLQQYTDSTWHTILFSSRKMTPVETRYSTFDRELLAVYLAIKHFRHFLEGRPFHVLTDHKPLTFALNTQSDRYSPHQAQHLDYFSQCTSNIRHVHGLDNVVADALSRIETNALLSGQPPTIDFAAMAKTQATDSQIHSLQSSPHSTLVVEAVPLPHSTDLYCDTSTGTRSSPVETRCVRFLTSTVTPRYPCYSDS